MEEIDYWKAEPNLDGYCTLCYQENCWRLGTDKKHAEYWERIRLTGDNYSNAAYGPLTEAWELERQAKSISSTKTIRFAVEEYGVGDLEICIPHLMGLIQRLRSLG